MTESKYDLECAKLGYVPNASLQNFINNPHAAKLVLNETHTDRSVPSFLRTANSINHIRELEFLNFDFTIWDDSANALASLLLGSIYISNLTITNCTIDADSLKHVFSSLGRNTSLTGLVLTNMSISLECFSMLFRCLGANSNISSLTIEHCYFSDDHCVFLANILAFKKTLCYLSLAHNLITVDGCTALLKGLETNTSLSAFYIYDNPIRDEGLEVIAPFLTRFPEINLSNCLLSGTSVDVFEKHWKVNGTIPRSIDLRNNRISNGIVQLALMLGTMPNLTALDLENNKIGSGAGLLAMSLSVHPSLTNVNLSNNLIGDETSLKIAEALTTSPNLKLIDMKQNFISDSGEVELIKIIQALESDASIDISNQFIVSEEEMADIVTEELFFTRYAGIKATAPVLLEEYTTQCKGIGMEVCPLVVDLLERLGRPIVSLDEWDEVPLGLGFENCNLGVPGCHVIAQLLKLLPGTRLLKLTNSQLNSGFGLIVAAIQDDGITELDVANCGLNEMDISGLDEMIAKNQHLKVINLSGNDLSSYEAQAHLCNLINKCSSISKLVLENVGFSESTVHVFESLLVPNIPCTDLVLDNNAFGAQSAVLCRMLCTFFPYLWKLSLINCGIEPVSISGVATLIKTHPTLRHLSLDNNGLSVEVSDILAQALQLSSLESLSVRGNPLNIEALGNISRVAETVNTDQLPATSIALSVQDTPMSMRSAYAPESTLATPDTKKNHEEVMIQEELGMLEMQLRELLDQKDMLVGRLRVMKEQEKEETLLEGVEIEKYAPLPSFDPFSAETVERMQQILDSHEKEAYAIDQKLSRGEEEFEALKMTYGEVLDKIAHSCNQLTHIEEHLKKLMHANDTQTMTQVVQQKSEIENMIMGLVGDRDKTLLRMRTLANQMVTECGSAHSQEEATKKRVIRAFNAISGLELMDDNGNLKSFPYETAVRSLSKYSELRSKFERYQTQELRVSSEWVKARENVQNMRLALKEAEFEEERRYQAFASIACLSKTTKMHCHEVADQMQLDMDENVEKLMHAANERNAMMAVFRELYDNVIDRSDMFKQAEDDYMSVWNEVNVDDGWTEIQRILNEHELKLQAQERLRDLKREYTGQISSINQRQNLLKDDIRLAQRTGDYESFLRGQTTLNQLEGEKTLLQNKLTDLTTALVDSVERINDSLSSLHQDFGDRYQEYLIRYNRMKRR
ncbi:hypothetical protein PCE1_002321 [Barthelona sp. PCE]